MIDDYQLLYCMKISRHENFAVSWSSSENREIKMPEKISWKLDREIKMLRKMNLEIDREIRMQENIFF